MSLVLVSRIDSVGLIKLNRPSARNALSSDLIEQLLGALKGFDSDPEVGAIVLTGSDTVFCAGADIKELKNLTFVHAYMDKFLQNLNDGMSSIRKPVVAAINGYALGGGCELAMMCDIMYAGGDAIFGQPEVKVGTIPGAGGTQRLIRAIGKAKAMHMILTGDTMTAQEAEAAGLVAKVFPADQVLSQAIDAAQRIGKYSLPVIAMAKEATNQGERAYNAVFITNDKRCTPAEELSLSEGQRFESRIYHATFGLNDSQEGMSAFVEKREAKWTNS